MKATLITKTKYAKQKNCIWRAARNLFSFTIVGKFVKGVLLEDPPQHKAPMLVLGTASLTVDMDEDGSFTIQQKRVENSSSGEGSIPRVIRRNKVRRLKEKVKANDDYAVQQEVTASSRLMAEQNAITAEERNRRHEEWAKQIEEEMDDKNMEMNTSNYTPISVLKA